MSANPIVHWELIGADGNALKTFYSGLFDWTFSTPEGFDSYHFTEGDDMGVNGAVGQGREDMPDYQALYVRVADIVSKLGEVESLGGSTVMPRTEIPGVVTYALFRDPAGNLVGLVEGES
ncbi:MAG: VOC family protein [Acidimicrobiia bacterium]